MPEQKPSIGRIVHFYDRALDRRIGPYAAIVTWVHDDGSIDLDVFGQRVPSPIDATSRVTEGVAESVQEAWWHWPPRVA